MNKYIKNNMYNYNKKILNNKPKYCINCDHIYTINSWSSHTKTQKHKNNIKYPPSKQILITIFLKKK